MDDLDLNVQLNGVELLQQIEEDVEIVLQKSDYIDQWFSIFLGLRPKFSSKNLSRPPWFYIYRIKKVISKNNFFKFYYLFITL